MKRKLLLLLLLFNQAYGQNGLDNLWLMGYDCCSPGFGGTNIDFYSGSAVISSVSRPSNFQEQIAVMSDSLGNLLFYTNGIFVYDANDSVMQNCDTLVPNSCTSILAPYGGVLPQGCLIIPKPLAQNIYYLFHVGCDYSNPVIYPKALYLTEIDMSLNGGLGGVTSNNVPLINTPLTFSFLTGVRHANGRDWWVVAHTCNGDEFITFLVTPQGVQGPFTQHIGFSLIDPISGIGETWFNRNGDRLVTTSNTDINLFDFDRCTGLFSNWTYLSKPDTLPFTGGCSFSASGRYLYYSEAYHLYQYDISVSNWQNTETLIATFDGFISTCVTPFYAWVLMGDNKIYGVPTTCSSHHLHLINSPDSAGLACDVQQHAILLPTENAFTFPNYPNYRLGKLDGSPCDTLSAGIENVESNKLFYFHPNPATNQLNVTLTKPITKNTTLTITDMQGRVVKEISPLPWERGRG